MTEAERLSKNKVRKLGGKVRSEVRCNLREIREKLGLSQRDVAVAVGVSPGGYCQIEQGSNVGVLQAIRLGKFFGLPVEAIWSSKAEHPAKKQ